MDNDECGHFCTAERPAHCWICGEPNPAPDGWRAAPTEPEPDRIERYA